MRIAKIPAARLLVLLKRSAAVCCLVTALAIIILSLLPELPPSPFEIPYLDKAAHALAYTVLGFFGFFAFYKKGRELQMLIAIAIVCTLFGGLLELLQALTHRSTELLDLLADGAGATLGVLCGNGLLAHIKKKLPDSCPAA